MCASTSKRHQSSFHSPNSDIRIDGELVFICRPDLQHLIRPDSFVSLAPCRKIEFCLWSPLIRGLNFEDAAINQLWTDGYGVKPEDVARL